ncbi:MAG: hypothetical protein K6G24_12505 [Lachnospiraceae bacterium]|nr:hypothetical protein [Lachnospiraceae bacterium]
MLGDVIKNAPVRKVSKQKIYCCINKQSERCDEIKKIIKGFIKVIGKGALDYAS